MSKRPDAWQDKAHKPIDLMAVAERLDGGAASSSDNFAYTPKISKSTLSKFEGLLKPASEVEKMLGLTKSASKASLITSPTKQAASKPGSTPEAQAQAPQGGIAETTEVSAGPGVLAAARATSTLKK